MKTAINLDHFGWLTLSYLLRLITEAAPVNNFELESFLLADLYRRRITTFTWFKPTGKERFMKIKFTQAELFAIHKILCGSLQYDTTVRMYIEPKLQPAKTPFLLIQKSK